MRIKVVSPRWDFSWYSERVFTAHFLFWSQFSSHEKGAKNILARVCAMANGSCLVLGQGYTIWTREYSLNIIPYFVMISKKYFDSPCKWNMALLIHFAYLCVEYTMRKNLPQTLDQLIFCKYTLVFCKCSQIY